MTTDPLSRRLWQITRSRQSLTQAFATLLLLGLSLGATACARPNDSNAEAAPAGKAVSVAVGKVVRTDLSQTLRVAAEFRPFQEIDIHAKVAGYVKHIDVDVGDRVKAGETLAVLEVPELQDELNQAAASVRQSQQEVEQAQHELRRAQATYTVAHLAYTRLEAVFKSRPDIVAQQDVDDAQGKNEAADAQVLAAKAGLAGAQEHLAEATDNQQRVQALFDYTRITAPFDGVITARYADTGAMLAAGTSSEQQALPLVRLSQNGLLRLEIPVPEEDVPLVHLGKKVSVQVQALNESFGGTVARFADKVNTNTRTMMTEVDVPNPTLKIVPGMYADVAFPIVDRKQALAVPVQAITGQGNNAVAYRVSRDNRIEIVPVTLGIQSRGRVEIRAGLSDGDRVVLGSTSQLLQNELVTPKLVELSQAKGAD